MFELFCEVFRGAERREERYLKDVLKGQRGFEQIADNKDWMKGIVGTTKPDLMSFTIDCDILCWSVSINSS